MFYMFKNNFGKQKEYFCNANVDPDDNAVADVEMPTLRFTNGQKEYSVHF